MPSKTIYKQQFPKHGYEIRTEIEDNPIVGGEPTKTLKAYTISGDYIGDRTTAEYLCEIQGIAPELATPESKVCSIGFCEKEQKWYGWSHHAIRGFGIGSTMKRAPITDIPPEDEETPSPQKKYHGIPTKHKRTSYPAEPAEEWTAKTLDDARQMAIDFADGVS